ncbi:MAG: polysaccharide biosynthesis tyrosine autokinase [Akkermansiaceae bacterium]
MTEVNHNNDHLDQSPDAEAEVPLQSSPQKSRIRMAFTRWWIILIFAVMGYVVSLYTLSIAEPTSSAKAVIEVVTKKRQLVGSDLESDRVGLQQAMQTMASKILGSTQLRKVVNSPKIQSVENAMPPKFSMKPKYWRGEDELRFRSAAEASTSEIVSMITGNLSVRPRPGTMLMDVNVSHADPNTAITIADAIVEEFIRSEQNRIEKSAGEAYKILKADAAMAAADVETAQRAMSTYTSVMATNARIVEMNKNMVSLKLRYKAKHPTMIDAAALLADIKKRFRNEITAIMQNPSELDFWSEYKLRMKPLEKAMDVAAANEAQKEAATKAEEQWFALVQGAISARTGALTGEISNRQNHYNRVIARITDIEVAEKNDQFELKIAEKAFGTGNKAIDKYKRLTQGVALGALIGFGISYILGMLDFKIYDVRTVEEATNLPCLAAIPESTTFDIEDRWQNVLDADPRSSNAESIRNLRASIMLLGKAERNKSILITSAAPGEGKTTIASELAASFALNEQKTILVDLDLRKPRVHTLFPDINESLGISEVLSGQADLAVVVQRTSIQGLHVICAGTKPPNPSELLQENEIADIISKLCEYYDRVIVDTPPVLPVSDTRLLAQHVQTVILVVRALKIPVGAIIRTKELLEQARIHVSGVVINAMKRKHIGSGYYGYRGYGEYGGSGGYGGYYDDDDEDDNK